MSLGFDWTPPDSMNDVRQVGIMEPWLGNPDYWKNIPISEEDQVFGEGEGSQVQADREATAQAAIEMQLQIATQQAAERQKYMKYAMYGGVAFLLFYFLKKK